MPSANGVYSLPPGYLAVTGTTILASQHNPPLEDVAAALTARLSRDGTAAMTGSIQFVPGTVNIPGAVFSTDLSSGFYKTATGIGVAIGGVKAAEFTAAGIASGVFPPGLLLPHTCMAAPSALWLLPFGQTVSRTVYAALWAQAQIEIAAGSTLYNNGDGSTTFGIVDMRGRLPVGWDSMGGTGAGRVTTAGSGVDGTTLGAAAGAQNKALITANLPPYTPAGTIAASTSVSNGTTGLAGNSGGGFSSGGAFPAPTAMTLATTATFTGIPAPGQISTPVQIMPPVVITNYILFAGGAV
jgi:microcystin-dependent protein